MGSRPIWELDCPSRDALFGLCLSDVDLDRLGVRAAECGCGCSTGLHRRRALLRACLAPGELGRRTGDLLDLRFADVVLSVRSAGPDQLGALIATYRRDPITAGLGPLLWALLTDTRREVQRVGRLLVEETRLASLQLLAYATRAQAGFGAQAL